MGIEYIQILTKYILDTIMLLYWRVEVTFFFMTSPPIV